MKALPTAVILHIIIEQACFDTPAQVAASVKAKFGIEVSRQRIEAYHPERRAGAKLGKKWRTEFYLVRARLLAELHSIPIACKSYRLRQLERVMNRAEDMGNIALAVKVLEQAACEAGGMHASRAVTPK